MTDAGATTSVPLPEPSVEAGREAPPRRPLTRREMVAALAAGGAALAVTNTGTALVSGRISTAIANRRAQVKIDELQAKVARLEKQLALYQEMERIGLDRLIRTVLEAYDRFWPPVRAAVGLLLGAVRTTEEGLTHFELKLPAMRSTTRILSDLLTGMEAQIQSAQDTLNDLLQRTGPIGEAVRGFITWLLNRNPFGITAAVREAADRLSTLVAGFPLLIADVRKRLLGPLDEEWLPATAGLGLQGLLFDPLRNGLLAPLRTHLEEIDAAARNWERESAPLRSALTERERLRAEIARLEQEERYAATEVEAQG